MNKTMWNVMQVFKQHMTVRMVIPNTWGYTRAVEPLKCGKSYLVFFCVCTFSDERQSYLTFVGHDSEFVSPLETGDLKCDTEKRRKAQLTQVVKVFYVVSPGSTGQWIFPKQAYQMKKNNSSGSNSQWSWSAGDRYYRRWWASSWVEPRQRCGLSPPSEPDPSRRKTQEQKSPASCFLTFGCRLRLNTWLELR